MSYNRTWNEISYIPKRFTIDNSVIDSGALQVSVPQSRGGSKVYDWRLKIREGRNATSSFSASRASVRDVHLGRFTDTLGWVTFPSSPPRVEVYTGIQPGWGPGDPTHLTVDSSKVDSVALSKVHKKIAEELQHLNSLAIGAELRQTIGSFRRPFRAVVDLLNAHFDKLNTAHRSIRGRHAKNRAKDWRNVVASTTLEINFGLAPLISDTKDIAEAIARFHTEKDLSIFRKKVSARYSLDSGSTSVNPDYSFNTQMQSRFYTHALKKTVYQVVYDVGLERSSIAAFGSNERLLQLLGITPAGLLPALWEGMPWSWLVDYFSNISEILEAGTADTSLVSWISRTARTETTEYRMSRFNSGITSPANFKRLGRTSNIHGSGSAVLVRKSVTRTDPGTLGVPSLYFEHPFENLKKDANLVSVLWLKWQQLPKRGIF